MELTVEAEAYNLRLKDQRNHDLWLAWHIGAFSRCERLPDLKDLLEDSTPVSEEEERKRNQAGIMSVILHAGAAAARQEQKEKDQAVDG